MAKKCNCLATTEKKAIEHISKTIAERYKGFEVNKDDSGYTSKVLSFSNGWLHSAHSAVSK